MRVLLISPPAEDFFFTPQRAYPLGLLYLGTALAEAGIEVKIINCPKDYAKKVLNIPQEFSYLKKYYQVNKSPFRLFGNYYGFGADYSAVREVLREFKPDIAGISSNFSAYLDSALKVAALIKDFDRRIVVVMGGRAVTASPEFALGEKYVDFVLRGEAEDTFLKFCLNLKRGFIARQKGLCYKKANNKMYICGDKPFIKNLNRLPVLNRNLINYKDYKFKGLVSSALLASRGCGMGCAFCAIGGPFRYRSAKSVLREMEECFSLGIRHFNFEDDNINLNPEFEKMLDMITERFEGRIKISFMSGMLSLGINRRLKEKLVKSGLTHVDLSIASSGINFRRKLKRREQPGKLFSLAAFMSRRSIPVTVHYIVGFPEQKFSDAVADLRYLADRPVLLGPSIFYPVIESGMFSGLKKIFPLKEENYRFFRSSAAYFDKSIKRDRIFVIFYFSRIINFIKEFMSKFEVEQGSLKRLLKEKLKDLVMEENIIYSPVRLDMFYLGMIILDRLLCENKIYRVNEFKEPGKFRYDFKQEQFASEEDIGYILKGLKVKSLKGGVMDVGGV